MQIYDFVEPELDRLRELCNFSDDERRYFELRSKHKSNIEIAFAMNVSDSQVSKLSRKVRAKIAKII